MSYYKQPPENFRESRKLKDLKAELSELLRDGSEWAADMRRRTRGAIRSERLRVARTKGTHTDEQWQAVLDEFYNRCVGCGGECIGRPCKDHIVPIYMGGSDGIDNLQPLCRQCNTAKGPDCFDWAQYRRDNGWGEGLCA